MLTPAGLAAVCFFLVYTFIFSAFIHAL